VNKEEATIASGISKGDSLMVVDMVEAATANHDKDKTTKSNRDNGRSNGKGQIHRRQLKPNERAGSVAFLDHEGMKMKL
jgi:hypothetical protein